MEKIKPLVTNKYFVFEIIILLYNCFCGIIISYDFLKNGLFFSPVNIIYMFFLIIDILSFIVNIKSQFLLSQNNIIFKSIMCCFIYPIFIYFNDLLYETFSESKKGEFEYKIKIIFIINFYFYLIKEIFFSIVLILYLLNKLGIETSSFKPMQPDGINNPTTLTPDLVAADTILTY